MGLGLDAVTKSYGAHQVLEPTSLDLADGEFLTILGPSGSGKTTILRLAGGFTRPTSGRIRFGGTDITDLPTNRRPFNTVFQDYALFPHMTVADNVGYGLLVRGRPGAEIKRKVGETVAIVGLSALLQRYPAQLSGGQRQRVALARAIVCEPKLILLDEPLAALDAELRRQMQVFLKDLQRRIATTFLFVTHDQEEAIALSDRIVMMNTGRIEQIGTPKQIYYRPETRFVAGFFGDNNLIEGRVGSGYVETPIGRFPANGAHPAGTALTLAIRPERIALGETGGGIAVPCRIEDAAFAGAISRLRLRPLNEAAPPLVVKLANAGDIDEFQPGRLVTASIRPDDIAAVGPAS